MKNKIVNRKTNEIIETNEDKINIFLYNTIIGRMILKIIVLPFISKIYGCYLNSKLSKLKIKSFIKNNNINMEEYIDEDYKCFNDFFIRNIKPDKRAINMDKNILISPCDAKLSAYKVSEDNTFKIKNSLYKVNELINEDVLNKYQNGYVLVFRLGVDDYHHYSYIDDGYQVKNHFIKGVLHTVRPIAQIKNKIFSQNQREWTKLYTENFGEMLMIEVGALMVGKIVNLKENNHFSKGEEKGYFKFGASTVILLVNNVSIDQDIIKNTKNNMETIVKLGERIGNTN